jgi:iron-sulfur cluster insertion protein
VAVAFELKPHGGLSRMILVRRRQGLLTWTAAPSRLTPMSTDVNAVEITADAALVFTDAAARKVGDLIRGEGNPNLMLRVFVQGGGCSGLQYGFEFDEQIQDGDTCVENQGVKLLVDPMSAQYLMGAEIDYREGLEGAQFVIRNPNATTTCGCGSSFSA